MLISAGQTTESRRGCSSVVGVWDIFFVRTLPLFLCRVYFQLADAHRIVIPPPLTTACPRSGAVGGLLGCLEQRSLRDSPFFLGRGLGVSTQYSLTTFGILVFLGVLG